MNGAVEKPQRVSRFEEALAVVRQIILLFCEFNRQNNNVHSELKCSDGRLGWKEGLEMEKVRSEVCFPSIFHVLVLEYPTGLQFLHPASSIQFAYSPIKIGGNSKLYQIHCLYHVAEKLAIIKL